MARALDDLSAFEDFTSTVLPKIQEMLKAGKSAPEIISWGQALLAARNLTIALTSPDEKTALVASKDLLDRGIGKAAEKIELTQRYEALSDEELEALLHSQEADLQDEDPHAH